MKLKELTASSEARAKFAIHPDEAWEVKNARPPVLLFWRDGAAIRSLPLQQVKPPP